jgi:hypothetical protein
MSIVNRRNALIGWATWKVGKRVAKKKARTAVPTVEDGRPNKPAIAAAGAAALVGSLLFWKARKRGSEPAAVANAEADAD